MRQRVHLITLGVADPETSARFYDAIGWARVPDTPPGVIAYDILGACFGLYDRAQLAEDLGRAPGHGSGGMTLSANTRSKDEVDAVLDEAAAAGATVLRAAHDMAWGGYGGAFEDPDGHVWEVIYNPFSPLGADDAFQWSGA